MKFGLAIAALSIGCLAQPGNIVFDLFGNQGLGTDNQYQGSGNVWIGDRNRIFGVDNTVVGNDNKVTGENNGVAGGLNSITGGRNDVTGSGNRVMGEGNIVKGEGNIISNDLNDIPFDIESRLPEWMRSTKTKTEVVPPVVAPVITPVVTPVVPRTEDKTVSPQRPASPRWSRSCSRRRSQSAGRQSPVQPAWRPNWVDEGRNTRPLSPGLRQPGFSTIGQRGFSGTRKPSYREVTHSPGRTEIRQIYETPNGRSEVYKSISRSGAGRTTQSFSTNFNSGWGSQDQDWRSTPQSWGGQRQTGRGREWDTAGDWNNWQTQNRWDSNAWSNLRQNNNWADKMRRDAQRSSEQLRNQIQNDVQRKLDKAFRNMF